MGSSIIARVDLAGLEPSSAAVAGPSTVYHTLCTHIQRQHHQNLVGKTAINISARSFHQSGAASAGPPAPGSAATGRRMMYVIKRNVEASAQQPAVPEGVDSTVLIEDAAAQRRSDWILESRKAEVAATAADKGKAKATDDDAEPQDGAVAMDVDPALPTTITTIPRPSHFRSTIAVLPGSFDQLLANTLILPPGGPSQSNAQAASTRWTHRPAVISLEGTVFRLGGHRQVQAGPTFTAGRGDVGAADWLVRVLTVAVRGNAPRPWAAVEVCLNPLLEPSPTLHGSDRGS